MVLSVSTTSAVTLQCARVKSSRKNPTPSRCRRCLFTAKPVTPSRRDFKSPTVSCYVGLLLFRSVDCCCCWGVCQVSVSITGREREMSVNLLLLVFACCLRQSSPQCVSHTPSLTLSINHWSHNNDDNNVTHTHTRTIKLPISTSSSWPVNLSLPSTRGHCTLTCCFVVCFVVVCVYVFEHALVRWGGEDGRDSIFTSL